MFFLTPRHVKHGRAFVKDARKLLAYKRDLVSDATVGEVEREITAMEQAVKTRDKGEIERQAQKLDEVCGKLTKPIRHAAWRENTEVFLVAIVIALGVRTYFLQPFTIPTGSMQPTLNGIIGYRTTEPPPNIVVRFLQKLVFGRTWIEVVAKTDDVIVDIREFKRLGLFTRTELRGERNSYVVNCPAETLHRYFMPPLRPFRAGEVMARGYYDTGDHVFVDKLSYHFRKPKGGEVFVFTTQKVPTQENLKNPGGPSQFYIKRLVGTPGDELRIDPPILWVNGEPAKGKLFEKVMSAKDGYPGYTPGPPWGLLSGRDQPYRVPEKTYFAMGDNSPNSQDSRFFGSIPEQNIMGQGLFVYWPFTRHWGLIK